MSASLLTIGVTVILWACQKEKYPNEELSAAIAASSEMEEYIISGYEMQAALNEFQQAMNAVDWSKMSFVKDENGDEVMHLPVQSLTFEVKLRTFNDRKRALQRRYPEIISMDMERCGNVIQSCVQRSQTVSTRLLDMGVNVFQPRTKQVKPEWWMDTEDYQFLVNWVAYSGDRYVEDMMLVFADGRTTTYIAPGNTPISASLPTVYKNGNRYFANDQRSPIRVLIHTHSDRMGISPDASAIDKVGKFKDVNNVTYGIYYQGKVKSY